LRIFGLSCHSWEPNSIPQVAPATGGRPAKAVTVKGMNNKPILVIGAGMSGLMAANSLQNRGYNVQILDKSRGLGGRCATRRVGDAVFDHGAQFFTMRDSRMRPHLDKWLERGVAVEWCRGFPDAGGDGSGDGEPRYRGAPSMTAMAKYLARNLDVRIGATITNAMVVGDAWEITLSHGESIAAAAIIMTAPLPQAMEILDSEVPLDYGPIRPIVESVPYKNVFAVMAVLDRASAIPAPGAVRDLAPPLTWVADNHMKGISTSVHCVTIHADGDYSSRHFGEDHERVADELIEAARPWLGDAAVTQRQVHRWRYAAPLQTVPQECALLPGAPPLVFAGDAFGGPRVEGACISGLAAAETLAQSLG